MAAGLTPKYIQDFPLEDLNSEEFLMLAVEAGQKTGWQIVYVSDAGLIARTINPGVKWNAEIRIVIKNGVANLRSESSSTELVDWGKNRKNLAAFVESFNELKAVYSHEDLAIKFEGIRPYIVPPEQDILLLPPPSKSDQVKGFFFIFKPTKGYFITPILALINIILFAVMVINGADILEPAGDVLIRWGANYKPNTLLDGEWWRLITSCFLHIGILHLLANMYALMSIGFLLEPYLGKSRFLAAYLLAGIAGGITSLWWHSTLLGAGASGAIFGMYGVFLAMLTTNLIDKKARKPLLLSIIIFVAFNLTAGLKNGIDNAAHIGGLVSGLVAGYAYLPGLKNPNSKSLKYTVIAVLTVLIVGTSTIIYNRTDRNSSRFERLKTEFGEHERKAMEVYRLPINAPKDTILFHLKEQGVDEWDKSLSVVNKAAQLQLRTEDKEMVGRLRFYAAQRLKAYDLMYKAKRDSTSVYDPQLVIYNRQIDSVLMILNASAK